MYTGIRGPFEKTPQHQGPIQHQNWIPSPTYAYPGQSYFHKVRTLILCTKCPRKSESPKTALGVARSQSCLWNESRGFPNCLRGLHEVCLDRFLAREVACGQIWAPKRPYGGQKLNIPQGSSLGKLQVEWVLARNVACGINIGILSECFAFYLDLYRDDWKLYQEFIRMLGNLIGIV